MMAFFLDILPLVKLIEYQWAYHECRRVNQCKL